MVILKSNFLGRLAAAILTGLVLYAPPQKASSQSLPPTEYEVKAAFLYNFAKFVQWPDHTFQDEKDPLVLGLIGDDPFGNTIDTVLKGTTVQNHPLILKRIKDPQTESVHMLFISVSGKENLKHILVALKGKPVLTVSDIPNFIDRGGMIGFETTNDKVRFSINKAAADAANLQFSSQVLKLATTVKATSTVKGDE